jgi:hypothetical protein
MDFEPTTDIVEPSAPCLNQWGDADLTTGLICASRYIDEAETDVPTSNGVTSQDGPESYTNQPFLAVRKDTKWPDGYRLKIKFVQKPIGTPKQVADTIQKIKNFASQWEQLISINFIWLADNDTTEPDIRIAFQGGGKGDWSYIGKESTYDSAKRDFCTMNYEHINVLSTDDLISGLVLHEFGHALGCVHEHQGPAAQQLYWNKPVVEAHYKTKYGWEPKKVEDNIFKRWEGVNMTNSEYDPDSIMLYEFPANFFTNGKPTKSNYQTVDWRQSFHSEDVP